MEARKTLNFGMVGHKFMGKAHSHALRDVNMFFDTGVDVRMHTLCGIGDDLEQTAQAYGWENCETDWRKVVNDPQIDVISICSPGVTHMEVAVTAAKAGKHVICEKPLAMSAEEAKQMCDAVTAGGVKHMINFCYRRVPAVTLAKQLLDSGKIGRVTQFRATYQQDWVDEDCPFVWRFDRAIAGAGSMADKGSHVIDLARYLVGEIAETAAMSDIFIPTHKDPVTGEAKLVTTDDAAMFLTRFTNGVMGVFQTSRVSPGYKNALRFEVTGTRGTIRFDLERLNELELYCMEEDKTAMGFKTIVVTEPVHPYIKNWWPLGHVLGWEHAFVHQYYELIKAITSGTDCAPDFYDGLQNMRVIDAVERAADTKTWVTV